MNNNNTYYLGAISFFTIIIFIAGILFLQDISFNKSKFTFTVIFENVQGLNNGDSVSMLGKRIGSVSKIRILGQKIAVELSIENNFDFNIPIDSEIEVKSEGLLGEKYVSIKPGLKINEYIGQGETVEGKREYDFSEITPGIVPMTQDLGAFARRLKATLNEAQKTNIQNSLKNIESITFSLDSLLENIQSILSNNQKKNIQNIISNLDNSSKSIDQITDEINKALKNDIVTIDTILNNIRIVSDNSKKVLGTAISSINTFNNSTKTMETILDKVNNGNGSISLLLNDDRLYFQMDSLILDIRDIASDFKINPGKYIKAYFKYK